ncbi:hypothetical protein PFICI_15248 [Pestalotiopsis fici W106-1]|uniref:Zn(2)-C6 fungal-type domain-containing protein n=1 Tax=Pestalotiopsis fici (strain W106-1 / CGMCC3.15140) TaxID=1229662 RepID=W3WGP1_PESFW|nr:uncharacterized protein PFICI_15248 [Pestalotiopsis fici W106-1]ETS73073.1 hypothetical protein PFICI_15248 [Pestalotiopsis fici W106-1]
MRAVEAGAEEDRYTSDSICIPKRSDAALAHATAYTNEEVTGRRPPKWKRKIKCDEAKPWCFRCTSTSRRCEGYKTSEVQSTIASRQSSLLRSASASTSAAAAASATSPLSEGLLDTRLANSIDEHKAFHAFLHSGTFTLGCSSDIDLWCRYIPQLFHTEPAIRHAGLAIGSLLLQNGSMRLKEQSPIIKETGSGGDGAFAVHHYQKAIQSTLRSMQSGRKDIKLAGITCILFFSIEALQGHEHEALQLFKRGNQFRPISSFEDPNHADPILAGLEQSFSRLHIQSSMFEGSVIQTTETDADLDGAINSTIQAQTELSSLILITCRAVEEGIFMKWMPQFTQFVNVGDMDRGAALLQIQARVRQLRETLQRWHTRFLAYKEQSSRKRESVEEAILTGFLLLRSESIYFWMVGCTEQSELVYDSCLPRFQEAVNSAGQILDLMHRSGKVGPFSFELGLMPPLFVIIQKCRDPRVRRQALDLLRRAPAQEGLWNRDIIVQVCEKTIELEEGSDGFVREIPQDRIDIEIPEAMRIKLVKVDLRTTLEDGRTGDFVDFYSLPHGFDREWCITRDFFEV